MATRLGRVLSKSPPLFRGATDSCHGRSAVIKQIPHFQTYSQRKGFCRLLCSRAPKTQRHLFSWLSSSKLHKHQCACRRSLVTTIYNHEQPPQQTSTNPYQIVQQELSTLSEDIKLLLKSSKKEIQELAQYYFDGQGKAFRPMIVLLISKACNFHQEASNRISQSQHKVALIAEMIHTASLVHDDVIDGAYTRRNKPSVNNLWGQRKAILAGDFILSVAAVTLARIRHEKVVIILSQVIEDLVRGEFMQLGSKEDENERFSHYLKKTFKKTASLLANSCKAVAVLGNCEDDLVEMAYQYGRHVGIAFQLIDDLLDYISSDAVLGKPTSADLRLGLATAPVLFAAQEYPELNPLIMRRFSEEGDVERAVELVKQSDGVRQTRMLAEKHCEEAVRLIQQLTDSPARSALIRVAEIVLSRNK
ncbi:all trans-polyprenyl-diphosphate synthase PDSS1-like [Liolophura sinensis]|uniref:all trans-polyprenyl-diphosphate synthase PDSS1-like n=1 Tax=Liolophura sinensis TaxID=3198878 RepID=UPI003158261C